MMDDKVLLALTLVKLGVATVEGLHTIWKDEGVDESTLDVNVAEVERRLARRA